MHIDFLGQLKSALLYVCSSKAVPQKSHPPACYAADFWWTPMLKKIVHIELVWWKVSAQIRTWEQHCCKLCKTMYLKINRYMHSLRSSCITFFVSGCAEVSSQKSSGSSTFNTSPNSLVSAYYPNNWWNLKTRFPDRQPGFLVWTSVWTALIFQSKLESTFFLLPSKSWNKAGFNKLITCANPVSISASISANFFALKISVCDTIAHILGRVSKLLMYSAIRFYIAE
jgi:hypothetical protein